VTCSDASDVFCEDFDEVDDVAALMTKWGPGPNLAAGGTLAIVSTTPAAPTPPHALEAVTPPDAGPSAHAFLHHTMVATSPTSTTITCDLDVWLESASSEPNALATLLQLEVSGDETAAGITVVTLLSSPGTSLKVQSFTSGPAQTSAVTTLTNGWRHLRVEVWGGPGDAGLGLVSVYVDRSANAAATASSVTSQHLASANVRLGLPYDENGTAWRVAYDNLVCAFGP
jgi:hypothetical protein